MYRLPLAVAGGRAPVLSPSQSRHMPSQSERKLCVVTGANSGIGLEVAAAALERGWHAVLACRSGARCAAAQAQLEARRLPGTCECAHLDLADYGSIRRFATRMKEQGGALGSSKPSVDVLVNNAGVMGVPVVGGVDGHLATNHLGTYLLTRLLLPLVRQGGRVVTVGSEAHRRSGALALGSSARGGWYARYARSKLANLLMTAELSRRLAARGSSVTAYCVSPGRVDTGIFRNLPWPAWPAVQPLVRLLFQTPQQGARTVVMASFDPGLAGRHVLYLHGMREATPAPAALDAAAAADLWALSSREVGLGGCEELACWPPG